MCMETELSLERAGLRGMDSLPAADLELGTDGGKLRQRTKLGGRDLYIRRITHGMDAELEEGDPGAEAQEQGGEDSEHPGAHSSYDSSPDSDRLEGRAAYLVRLEGLGDEYSRQYERSQSAGRMSRRWMRR